MFETRIAGSNLTHREERPSTGDEGLGVADRHPPFLRSEPIPA
jgi:hypothetical protein